METTELLTLSTIGGGELDERFRALIPAIMAQLKHDQKASISISIDFRRIQDLATMVSTTFRITPKYPALKKVSLCQVTGDNNLKTEKAQPKPEKISLFERTGE
ncbi:MAG: hypothetical protein WCP79_06810 [Bacillota bacterium]